jgi:hypothetical protein
MKRPYQGNWEIPKIIYTCIRIGAIQQRSHSFRTAIAPSIANLKISIGKHRNRNRTAAIDLIFAPSDRSNYLAVFLEKPVVLVGFHFRSFHGK